MTVLKKKEMPNCKKYIKNKKTRPFTKMAQRKDLLKLPNVVMAENVETSSHEKKFLRSRRALIDHI